ncbi:MAG TPA: response regulator transcription factor [Acidimicrobiales bacterium]
MTRVVIIEPHPLAAEGLRHVLIGESDFEVVGIGENCKDALELVERERPNILFMNLRLPDGDSLETVKTILERWPETHVVMRTDSRSCRDLPAVIEVGSVGLITIDRTSGEIVTAMRSAARGELLVRRHELGELVERLQRHSRTSDDLLSTRELEVLKFVAQAKPTHQIAENLFLSVHTVRNHIRNILFKFGAHSKMEAIALALQNGILDVGDISYEDPSEDSQRDMARIFRGENVAR